MGKRGPKSKNQFGFGHVTSKGYHRVQCHIQNRERMQHVLVWEAAHGPLPHGYQVHHINEDKLDNRLENLVALEAVVHKRIHGGCEVRDGEWWKPCRKCGVMQHLDSCFYKSADKVSPWCKRCSIANATANKRKRAAKKRGELAPVAPR